MTSGRCCRRKGEAMIRKNQARDRMAEELTARKNYESALENLKRFSEMLGGKLTQPSGIIRHSRCGQWQSYPEVRLNAPYYSSCGRGRAK